MRYNPYSIAAFLPVALISSGLFCTAAMAAEGAYTVHPWEFHERRASNHHHLDVDYAEVYDFYYNSPQRSITHGLHPLNRRRYYNPRPYTFVGERGIYGIPPLNEVYEYDHDGGRWTRIEIGHPAKGVECMNYSFNKPNYRVPPFGYRCQD
ncbi:MAG: hypothetical protein Greene101449_434 [Candidatus Peregrinibacteria bacterium Greene1014_49]|nr:MAG: hypothetical protein Greene101449_434 [Candidatus Peregrinibacteria bacterium Greene1014_49]